MTKPLKTFVPDFSGNSKVLFCNEGNPVAVLVTNTGKPRTKPMKFAQAEAALAWCRSSGAILVYCPVSPSRN